MWNVEPKCPPDILAEANPVCIQFGFNLKGRGVLPSSCPLHVSGYLVADTASWWVVALIFGQSQCASLLAWWLSCAECCAERAVLRGREDSVAAEHVTTFRHLSSLPTTPWRTSTFISLAIDLQGWLPVLFLLRGIWGGLPLWFLAWEAATFQFGLLFWWFSSRYCWTTGPLARTDFWPQQRAQAQDGRSSGQDQAPSKPRPLRQSGGTGCGHGHPRKPTEDLDLPAAETEIPCGELGFATGESRSYPQAERVPVAPKAEGSGTAPRAWCARRSSRSISNRCASCWIRRTTISANWWSFQSPFQASQTTWWTCSIGAHRGRAGGALPKIHAYPTFRGFGSEPCWGHVLQWTAAMFRHVFLWSTSLSVRCVRASHV